MDHGTFYKSVYNVNFTLAKKLKISKEREEGRAENGKENGKSEGRWNGVGWRKRIRAAPKTRLCTPMVVSPGPVAAAAAQSTAVITGGVLTRLLSNVCVTYKLLSPFADNLRLTV